MSKTNYFVLLYILYLWCNVCGIDPILSLYSSQPELKEGSACVVDHSGVKENGTCVSLNKCITATNVYLNAKAGFEEEWPIFICSMRENGELIICCTDCYLDKWESLKGKVLMEDGHVYKEKGTKAWKKCVEYFSKLPYRCRDNSKLPMPFWDKKLMCTDYHTVNTGYGGVDAKSDEFPHMALLGYGADRTSAQWLCGGSIISERYILSAAHCASTPKLGNVTFAALGILKRTDLDDYWRVYKIKTIIKHPEYKSPSKYHDIMLLETENEINFGKSILPACLDTGKTSDNILTATGWGRQGPRGELENHLQVMKLHKYNYSVCSELFAPHRQFINGYDNETQMCYGGKDKIVDTCEGDSGGPLQSGLGTDCLYHILGVTSFGKNCGIPGNAGMYTRVRYYVPWIESIVWADDCLICY